jgi:hypothetical protein
VDPSSNDVWVFDSTKNALRHFSPTKTPQPTPPIKVSDLAVSCSNQALLAGQPATCTAMATYLDDAKQPVSPTWSSSDSASLTVDQTGHITGGDVKAPVNVVVTASYTENGVALTQSTNVVVQPVSAPLSDLLVSCPAAIATDSVGQCTAAAVYTTGYARLITPSWNSSNGSVLNIDAKGAIKVNSVGEAQSIAVNVSYTENGVTINRTANIAITVPVSTAGLTLAKANCLFAWAEANYGSYFQTSGRSMTTNSYGAYLYRYYPVADVYLGISTATAHVYFGDFVAGAQIYDLGDFASKWGPQSGCR